MTSIFRRHRRGRPPHPDVLTPAEWRVLEEIRVGRSNPEIAERLDISRNTVKTHISSMLAKLDLADREQLAAWSGEPAVEVAAPRARHALLAPFAWLSGRGAAVAGAGATVIVLIAFIAAMESGRIIADDPAPPAGIPTPDATEPMAPPTGGDASHLLQPVDPSQWERYDVPANASMPLDHGMLFVNAATGDGELWAIVTDEPYLPYSSSPDGRFILQLDQMLDRDRHTAYTWSSELVGPPTDTGYALYQEIVGSCEYTLIDLNASPPQIAFEFTIPRDPSDDTTSCANSRAAIHDSGEQIFVAVSRGGTGARGQLFFADRGSGTVNDLGIQSSPHMSLSSLGNIGVVAAPAATTVSDSDVRLYAWDGTPIASVQEPSTTGGAAFNAAISPDGSTVAWQEHLLLATPIGGGGVELWPVVVSADVETGAPRFRVLRASLHNGMQRFDWLSDSSALIVGTPDGYALLSPIDGTLTQLPFSPAAHFDPIPLPAPDDPSRFLYDAAVLDVDGNVLMPHASARDEWGGGWWNVSTYEWSTTSEAIRIMRYQPGGRGFGAGGVADFGLPARVEFPPFDNEMRVRLPGTEEDRTLHEQPAGDAIDTLPVDTAVTVVDSMDGTRCSRERCSTAYDPDWTQDEPLFWIHVTDGAGLEGWLPARDLAWAE